MQVALCASVQMCWCEGSDVGGWRMAVRGEGMEVGKLGWRLCFGSYCGVGLELSGDGLDVRGWEVGAREVGFGWEGIEGWGLEFGGRVWGWMFIRSGLGNQ